MYNPPVRSDRPSSDGITGTGGATEMAASSSTSVSSEAENSSLKILKCLWAELRASAAKEASRRITGRAESSSSPADFFLTRATSGLFLKSLRDMLLTGKGRDGSGL